VALIVAGFAFGYPDLATVGTAAVVAVIAAAANAAWRPALRVSRVAEPDRVMRGESSTVTLTVHNASRLRGATMVALDRCGSITVPVPVLRLRPNHQLVTSYPVPTERRGVVDIGPLLITRSDPLGLVSVATGFGETVKVWVYPKVHSISAVPAGINRSLDGRVDKVPHGSITFDALREYVVGDDLRHVHWRTSARVGELMVREHVDTALPQIVVLLDDRAATHTPDSFEDACEAAASVVVAAIREDLHVALHTVSGAGVEGHGVTTPFLDLLAEADRTDGGDSLVTAAQRLRLRRLGDTLIYLTGSDRPEDITPVGALRGAYPSIVVGVLGRPDTGPSAAAGLLVLAARDGEDFCAAWDGIRSW